MSDAKNCFGFSYKDILDLHPKAGSDLSSCQPFMDQFSDWNLDQVGLLGKYTTHIFLIRVYSYSNNVFGLKTSTVLNSLIICDLYIIRSQYF